MLIQLKLFALFGLDRISDLITDNHFQREKVLELTADKFNQVYGLIYEPDDNPNVPIESGTRIFRYYVALSESSTITPVLKL